MSGGAPRRIVAICALAGLVALGGVLGEVESHAPGETRLPPSSVASVAASARATSSSWFCAGAPQRKGASSELLLVNSGPKETSASVEVIGALPGDSTTQVVEVPARGEAAVAPNRVGPTSWLGASVAVGGGGVSVLEALRVAGQWSLAPCASRTAGDWYFASGSTRRGSTLQVALMNPSQGTSVVDLTFITSSGVLTPQLDQGIVVGPRSLRVVTAGAYVQNRGEVATEVRTRSGVLVAGELQLFGPRGMSGLALETGWPAPSRGWTLPRLLDATGGTSQIEVVNPTSSSERVTLSARVEKGSPQPFVHLMGPESLWTLSANADLRVPTGIPYALRVAATGQGVVVAPIGSGAPRGPSPQWSLAVAVPDAAASAVRSWVVPSLLTASGGPAPVLDVGVATTGRTPVGVEVRPLGSGPAAASGHLHVAPGSYGAVRIGSTPAEISANGPLAVVGESAAPVTTAPKTPPSKGAVAKTPPSKSAATKTPPSKGAAAKTRPSKGAAAKTGPSKGAAAKTSPSKGAGAATPPSKGSASEAPPGNGAPLTTLPGAGLQIAVPSVPQP